MISIKTNGEMSIYSSNLIFLNFGLRESEEGWRVMVGAAQAEVDERRVRAWEKGNKKEIRKFL